MTFDQLTPRFPAPLWPIVATLATDGITANAVTLAICALSAVLGAARWAWRGRAVYFFTP
jgi:hypothetical protein